MSEPMNYLAIDPSTTAGWALRLVDGKVFHGVWKLKKPTERIANGFVFLRYGKEISKTLADHGVDPANCRIAIERQSFASIGTEQSQDLAAGWLAILDFWCAWKGAKSLVKVSPTTWRKAFIGVAMAPKEVAKQDRREWLKQKVMQTCAKRGLNPDDDNAADALGILFWVVNGGDMVQAVNQANKKAKTAAKRAQKRLAL